MHTSLDGSTYTSLQERLDGLLVLKGADLCIEWRTVVDVQQYGLQSKTGQQVKPHQEIRIPLTEIADARIKRTWYKLPTGYAIVVLAQHLQAFAALSENHGLPGFVLQHPAEITLHLRRKDRELAFSFVSALRAAISEHRLSALEEPREQQLPPAKRNTGQDS